MWELIFGTIKSIVSGAVGPFFQYLNKKEDVSLEKYKVDGTVNIEKIHAEIAQDKALKELHMQAMQFNFFRVCLYGVLVPCVIWFACGMYDSTFRELLPVGWTWRVLALPLQLQAIAGAAFTYLLAQRIWK